MNGRRELADIAGQHGQVVCTAWVSVVLVLYPVCAWYARLKRTHKRWWMSYI